VRLEGAASTMIFTLFVSSFEAVLSVITSPTAAGIKISESTSNILSLSLIS
jgi:hypothetical protein